MMSHQDAGPSPALLMDALSAHVRTAALKGAIELDLFTAIAAGSETVAALAGACGASERGIRILCDYLVLLGFLTKDERLHYRLTADSAAFLDRRSPLYLGGVTEFVLSPMVMEAHRDIAAAVRKGGTVLPDEGSMAPEHPVWVRFARAMAPLMRLTAQLMANVVEVPGGRPARVLDVAAGHGVFGITLAQRHPGVEVVALDWPAVLEVARENAEAAGVADRWRPLPGSAFDQPFGEGYDLVLLTNFLHHFDVPTCEALLRKARAALSEGGRVVTVEIVPNEDRVSPPSAAAFAMTMLVQTSRGDAYTAAELGAMLGRAGFSRTEFHPLPPSTQHLAISYC
ncbi:class I SAM-dependent methyltransferase [Sorangium sp. So ce281]|uniref:methyltransferase n=1 Tax=unclassified Sorangium TaxID=2621164 RepID=UPI003F605667